MTKDFEIIPHTADLQIRVYGKTKQDLFRHALIGMFQSIRPIAPDCHILHDRIVCPHLPIIRQIKVASVDQIGLLVDFLSEALYLSDIYNEAYLDVTIDEFSDTAIQATLYGISIKGFEVVEIKAVTYHNLDIQKIDDHWQADIVFDI
ncbi:MAG TPA: archease [Candidatus Babeliales bacterium]|jgi:SHS2 domain-containing protein|nr:archease [Candidatus Babeliales bacterium]